MEEAFELDSYLPLSFQSPKEQEYIAFLWEAFETNYAHGKYQFAFLAYHMLTMSFIYFNIWQIKQTEPKNFEMGLIGFGKDVEKNLITATLRWPRLVGQRGGLLRCIPVVAHTARISLDRSSCRCCCACGDVGKARSGLSIISTGGSPR